MAREWPPIAHDDEEATRQILCSRRPFTRVKNVYSRECARQSRPEGHSETRRLASCVRQKRAHLKSAIIHPAQRDRPPGGDSRNQPPPQVPGRLSRSLFFNSRRVSGLETRDWATSLDSRGRTSKAREREPQPPPSRTLSSFASALAFTLYPNANQNEKESKRRRLGSSNIELH